MKKKKNQKKTLCTLLLAACLLLSLPVSGCAEKKKAEPIDCPYTDLGWDTTTDALFEAKGDYIEAYNSTYGGQTYTYNGSYLGESGIVKYMYDEDNELMSVAFAYSANDTEELQTFYEKVLAETKKNYGESDSEADNAASFGTSYGHVWRMEEGNIILSVMLTDSNKALQIAYVNPKNQEKQEQQE